MKFAILASVMLFGATAANAVTYSSAAGAPDPGVAANQMVIDDFEGGMTAPAGITYAGSYSVDALNISGIRAEPAGDTSNYFATPGSADDLPGTAVIDFGGYIDSHRAFSSLSFYWGSIDSYNTLEVLDRSGMVLKTIVGNQMFNPADGNQTAPATNRRLFLQFAPGENFGALRLTSTQRAFEIDDFGVASVPEPATWAMLIVGMGFVGFANRRRSVAARVAS